MKKKLDKASVHNGRANSKGVAYNANHNTMELSRLHQPHIDPDRIHLNRYIQYLDGGAAIAHKGGEGGYDSRKHEVDRYRQLYGEFSEQFFPRMTYDRQSDLTAPLRRSVRF